MTTTTGDARVAARPAPPSDRKTWWERLTGRAAVWLLTVGFFVAWSAYAVSRHRQYLTAGHDLGIFDQAIRAYAHFQAPLVPIKGMDYSILGDHFHPILLTAVPLYWVFDDPRTLLVLQAALLAASIPIVHRFAARRMPSPSAFALTAGYALGWPLASMVDFDFHEIAFAVPFLAAAIDALDRRSDRALVLWCVALLLVREDLGAVVLVLGVLRGLHRPRRLGLALAALGAVTLVVVTTVVIPAMSVKGQFAYWTFDALGTDLPSSVRTLLTDPLGVLHTFVTPSIKAQTLAMLLVPLLALPLGSPYALVALPLLAERFLNSRPALWSSDFHYDAPVWVILVLAMVDSGGRWGVWRRRWWRRAVIGWLVVSQVLWILLGASPMSRLVDGSAWDLSDRMRDQAHAVALIPPDVCVSVDDRIAPHLVRTNRVALPGIPQPTPDYVIVDLTKRTPGYPAVTSGEVFIETLQAGYHEVFTGGGIHVLRAPEVSPRAQCRP